MQGDIYCVLTFDLSNLWTGESPLPCEAIMPMYFPHSSSSTGGGLFGGVKYKPLILLYPPKDTEVTVELIHPSGFSATFPEYTHEKKGWTVTAHPDGTLFDHTSGQEAYGLFWEGNPGNTQYDLSKGWIIQGSEIREFLYHKLTDIGLNTKERSDFIMYWYPKLQDFPYLQITFAGDDYTTDTPLHISPQPDSLLRLFMVAKPLQKLHSLPPQELKKFQRHGFSVVEWGGTVVGP